MKIHYLDSKHYLFGNHGAVWTGTTHICETGTFSGTTLCGIPTLSRNWSAIENVTEPGCPECIAIWKDSH